MPETKNKRFLEFIRKSPNFGFALERVAEMEFSFGHTEKALDALKKSLREPGMFEPTTEWDNETSFDGHE